MDYKYKAPWNNLYSEDDDCVDFKKVFRRRNRLGPPIRVVRRRNILGPPIRVVRDWDHSLNNDPFDGSELLDDDKPFELNVVRDWEHSLNNDPFDGSELLDEDNYYNPPKSTYGLLDEDVVSQYPYFGHQELKDIHLFGGLDDYDYYTPVKFDSDFYGPTRTVKGTATRRGVPANQRFALKVVSPLVMSLPPPRVNFDDVPLSPQREFIFPTIKRFGKRKSKKRRKSRKSKKRRKSRKRK